LRHFSRCLHFLFNSSRESPTLPRTLLGVSCKKEEAKQRGLFSLFRFKAKQQFSDANRKGNKTKLSEKAKGNEAKSKNE
jgi:hypothetical protein